MVTVAAPTPPSCAMKTNCAGTSYSPTLDYTGSAGADIGACGQWSSEVEISAACDKDVSCKGYTSDLGSYAEKFNYWFCLKNNPADGENNVGGKFYKKVPPVFACTLV